jgi:serine/threonine protein kinase
VKVVEEAQTQSDNQTGFASGVLLQGTYQILHPLGTGGMGQVYAASHARLPGLFAIKALHKEHAGNENAVLRFRGEAEIMAGLRHPNIVQVFDFNVAEDGTPFLAMEFIEGANLGERMRAGDRFAPEQVGKIVAQIARALDVAHRHGIVHRDLKPENVMLTCPEGQDDFIKVVDFGISKAAGSSRITSEKTLLGTPQFMAPEQAQGRHDEVGPRTDQFALAAMAYTLFAGCEPFLGDNPVSVLYQVVHEEAKPVASLVDWPCQQVDEVLRKAMSKNIADRYSTIMDFANALVAAVTHDLAPRNAQSLAPQMQSFVHGPGDHGPVSAPRSATPQPAEPRFETTVVIERPRRILRSATPLAAAGLAAAALLAFAQLRPRPWQQLRTALSGSLHQLSIVSVSPGSTIGAQVPAESAAPNTQ